jgi:predicted Zn-dependent protease
MDPEQHATLGGLWLDLGNPKQAIREFRAVLARNPIDPAGTQYQLARAYLLNKQPDEAREAVLASLEVAPGYRPAQKLLLELSAAEDPNPRDVPRN